MRGFQIFCAFVLAGMVSCAQPVETSVRLTFTPANDSLQNKDLQKKFGLHPIIRDQATTCMQNNLLAGINPAPGDDTQWITQAVSVTTTQDGDFFDFDPVSVDFNASISGSFDAAMIGAFYFSSSGGTANCAPIPAATIQPIQFVEGLQTFDTNTTNANIDVYVAPTPAYNANAPTLTAGGYSSFNFWVFNFNGTSTDTIKISEYIGPRPQGDVYFFVPEFQLSLSQDVASIFKSELPLDVIVVHDDSNSYYSTCDANKITQACSSSGSNPVTIDVDITPVISAAPTVSCASGPAINCTPGS